MVQPLEIPENISTASGLTGTFAFGFTYTHPDHVQVQVTPAGEDEPILKLQGFDYDVSGSAVIFRAGRWPGVGDTVRRFRVTPLEQAVRFGDMDRYRPQANEDAFDRVIRILQEVVAFGGGYVGAGGNLPVIEVPAVQDFTVEGVLRTGPDGTGWPAAAISAEPVEASQIADLIVQYRISPAGTWRSAMNLPAAFPSADFTAVLGGETYDFRARWRATDGGVSDWVYANGVEIPEGGFVSFAAAEIGGLTPSEVLAEIAAAGALGADAVAQVVALAVLVDGQGSALVAVTDLADDLATDLSGLTTTVGGHTASIAELLTTSADAASALTTLSATVDDQEASITTLQSVTAGIGSLWTLQLNVNGKVSGIRSYNGGDISSIVFAADQIGFSDGSSNLFPLAVVGGIVKATNFEVDSIRADTIVTNHLTGGAVSKVATSINIVIADLASETTINGFWFTCSGGKLKIDIFAIWTQYNAGNVGLRLRMYRDGTPILDDTWASPGPFADSKTVFQYDFPGEGTFYYAITMNTLTGISNVISAPCLVMVTELKKAG